MSMIHRVLTLLMLLLLSCSATAQESNQPLTLEQAIINLEAAIDKSKDADSRDDADSVSRLDVRVAAAALAYILQEEGIESADGELALGNAYFIGDDLGRAVLHYRRGLRINPTNPVLRENLAHARSFVEPTIPGREQTVSIRSVLGWWQRLLDGRSLWLFAVILLAVASLLTTIRMIDSKHRISAKIPTGFAIVAIIGMSLLVYTQWINDHDRGLVVVLPGTGLYSGPGAGVYQEVYDGALGVGTEAVLLEERGGWVNIRLSNEQTGWVQSDSITAI